MKTFIITQKHRVQAESSKGAHRKLAIFDSNLAERMAMTEEGEVEILLVHIAEEPVQADEDVA